MRKFLTALVAVTVIGATAPATSSTADARWGGGWGWRGGWGWGPGPFIGGALIGGALAAGAYAPYYYGNYGYGPYYPYAYGGYGAYGPYGPGYGCQRVWNGYYWVSSCY